MKYLKNNYVRRKYSAVKKSGYFTFLLLNNIYLYLFS